jgi:hypothetical protein
LRNHKNDDDDDDDDDRLDSRGTRVDPAQHMWLENLDLIAAKSTASKVWEHRYPKDDICSLLSDATTGQIKCQRNLCLHVQGGLRGSTPDWWICQPSSWRRHSGVQDIQ